jgi:hypothetical protein
MSKLSHSNPFLDDVLHAGNQHRATGKQFAYPPVAESCQRCGEEDFSPNVEAFELSGECVCDECAEEIFDDNSQFGVGA